MSRTPESAGAARDPAAFGTSAYDYTLPDSLIAHHPAPERDASRLLVVHRDRAAFEHRTFREIIDYMAAGDVLVLNETRVIPARLLARRPGGGTAEIVLLHPAGGVPGVAVDDSVWIALVRPGAKLKPGRTLEIGPDLVIEVVAVMPDGTRTVRLHSPLPVREAIERYGVMPLPPYIERDVEPGDRERYQTVYARAEGSVAAPTAGLHFTPALLDAVQHRGVEIARVVLHVGVGTFRPVEVEDPGAHRMHAEWYRVDADEAERINSARDGGGRLWAVGTTVARTLETVVAENGSIGAGDGWTRLFIRPGFRFRAVDRLITNFHLPRSTLLMLVAAFAGYDLTMRAYDEAIARSYRFYSYGDAMAVL